MDGMTLRIDPAGRIVVPKRVRQRLSLTPGSELELQESADGLILKPRSHKPSLVRRGRLLVHRGVPPRGFDPLAAIEQDREDRIRHLLGTR